MCFQSYKQYGQWCAWPLPCWEETNLQLAYFILYQNYSAQVLVIVLTSLGVGCWWCVVDCVCPCVVPDEGWWWWWTDAVVPATATDPDEDCWWCEDADVGAEMAEPADVTWGGDVVSCNNDGGCCCCWDGAVPDDKLPFSELCAAQI